jgi:hypothetical protein
MHFSGKFQAAPSTVNNDPVHFDNKLFTPNNQLPNDSNSEASNGWWNPAGTAYWRLRDTTITSVVYKDGTSANISSEDPIIGTPISDGNDSVPAKMVDLDPEQQMVSQIWGWSIKIGAAQTTEEFQQQIISGLKADFRVAPFCDIWVRYFGGHPDSFFSAVYQSILENIELTGNLDSRFLNELRKVDGSFPDKLSIKFTVDGFDDTRDSPTFTWGRIVGAIGPYSENEPVHFVNARYIRPTVTVPSPFGPQALINFAPARIDEKRETLFLDLGNSLLTTSVGGPTRDIGNLEIGILEGKEFHPIGDIPYQPATFISERAGIAEFKLSKNLIKLAKSNPLAIKGYNVLTSPPGDTPVILAQENKEGAFLRADNFVFRMEADSKAEVEFYATTFGKPAANLEIKLKHNSSLMEQQVLQDNLQLAGPPVGTPTSALKFEKTISTGKNGKARATLTAKDPGNPRDYIDGQVYGIQYTWDGISAKEYNANGTNMLSLLIFDSYKIKGDPTWVRDIQPILVQYANLYPVMSKILNLNSYHNVVERKLAMQLVFDRPISDPNYMPVTRDLSGAKKNVLLDWLRQNPTPKYIQINTLDDLKQALQIAIELEHATLPPYLTAYFSIIPGHNVKASAIIRSVLMEEMLHMSLACNLLNAIGGSPEINTPGFIPVYPTGLPGSLAPGLTVNLRKCSIDQIRDVFMAIEEPGQMAIPAFEIDGETVVSPELPGEIETNQMTIGWFYYIIKCGFIKLVNELGHDAVFNGDPSRQLRSWHGTGDMIPVECLDDAICAIHEIVEQGEGASPFNPDDGYDELAHYYKFAEIVEGRTIEILPDDEGYSYTGPVIPFDEKGVYNMIDNPGLYRYSDDSAAKIKSEMFNKSYTNLLNVLHKMFNGHPEFEAKAIGMMFSLTVQARDLMTTPIEPGSDKMAGPSFRYYPINYDS